jgi:hypothetical protein
MTFEYLYTIITHARGNHKQPFIIGYCVDNFYSWKDIVGKKVSKLRSIAELRAFDGIHVCASTRLQYNNLDENNLQRYSNYNLHFPFFKHNIHTIKSTCHLFWTTTTF